MYTFVIVIEVWWISCVTHLFVWNSSDMFCIALFCWFVWVQSFRFDTVGSLWAPWDGHYSDSKCRAQRDWWEMMGNWIRIALQHLKKASFHIARIFKKFCHFAKKKRVKRVWDELKLAGTVATHWNALDACKEVVVAGCDIRVWHPAQRKTRGFGFHGFAVSPLESWNTLAASCSPCI